MANSSEALNRLVIRSECRTTWEQMTGDGVRRFCAECEREVFDFARMSPTQIRAHLQASRGQLCARLTRQDGRLVTAREPALPPPAPPFVPRYLPALTAGLVAVCLGAGAGTARAAKPAAAATAIDSSAGQAAPEPAPARQETAANGAIAAQTVAVQTGEQRHAELFADDTVTIVNMGAPFLAAPPLREEFDASDLVAVAVVGPSVVVGRGDEVIEVSTDLHVESPIKGTVARGEVPYRHWEREKIDGEPEPWRAELVPGTRVLALLERAKPDAAVRGKPAFETTPGSRLRRLDDAEGAAYLSRLEALARLERQFARRGETNPVDVMEWIVATAENPLTRREATGELQSALAALPSIATEEGPPGGLAGEHLQVLVERFHAAGRWVRNEPPAKLLGAFLTAEHKQRLTAALLATKRLDDADGDLFALVRRWDEEAAREWLLRQLRTTPHGPGLVAERPWLFVVLADALKDHALREIAVAGIARQQEIAARWPPDAPAQETRTMYQEKLAALDADLRRNFAAVLAKGRPQ